MLNAAATETTTLTSKADAQLLNIYVWYRLILSGLLLLLQLMSVEHPLLGQEDPQQFHSLAEIYLIANILCVLGNKDSIAPQPVRSLCFILIDVIVLTLFIHTSGGITSNLPVLLVVTTAAGNILLRGRLGIFISAVATIGLLYEETSQILLHGLSWHELNATALLCLSFFGIAFLSQALTSRLRQSEALALAQERQLSQMRQLSTAIIQRMRTGMLAVNQEQQILLANDAASRLLGLDSPIQLQQLTPHFAPKLSQYLAQWMRARTFRPEPFQNRPGSPEISSTFSTLDLPDPLGGNLTLIYLEDHSQLRQQAQQLKLASLGRFTASIAHELRNPLAAISHAGQLLEESAGLTQEDQRLLQILNQHVRRMNRIIENILQLSRRQKSRAEHLNLHHWLLAFIKELQQQYAEPLEIQHTLPATDLWIRFDPEQLYQVIFNLCSNGLRYSRRCGSNRLWIETGVLESDQPYLQLTDAGPGIDEEQSMRLFEPFYTTEPQGTGLGLYIARELCQANLARLDYMPDLRGCSFRITFAHPDRISLST